ncbi:MAG: nuclear transport factor 2 family protein [Sediminibacterium sp.]|jgi:catechol 2,3-dioxygenase-like lactoylglutathione lyase family enzyme|nr:nuclear transport factor 2 family protein [Chitinophagaceae bacterium]MCA6445694.1 nuclear transport factor 2 family protein [Chitinophagaceae bacterium]
MKRFILFVSCYFIMHASMAQELSLSLNHIALSVKDVNASASFYSSILGLQEITNRTKSEGIRWFSLSDGKELHLVSTVKAPVTINKAVHMALTTSNMDGLIKKLVANNITYSDWPGTLNKVTVRADGILQIYIQDVDGYWIEVNSVAGDKNEEVLAKKEISAMLDTLNATAGRANFDAYFKLYTEDAAFIGTDATEIWDKKAFMQFAKPYFDKGKAWNFTALKRNIYVDKSGALGWFDELLNTQMKICRGSGVVVKVGNEWKLKQYVLSMTMPNSQVTPAVKLKAEEEDALIKKLISQ